MYGPITAVELQGALNVLLKQAQKRYFPEEIYLLARGQHIRTSSKLRSLTPFIDTPGILRVGGRLQNAHVS